MKRYLLLVGCLLGLMLMGGLATEVNAQPKEKVEEKVCVARIHVIKGCAACEAMQEWLVKAGIKLERQDVEQGPYRLYPTVVYSDKTVDHGERMYRQLVSIPEKICVISCSVGTN